MGIELTPLLTLVLVLSIWMASANGSGSIILRAYYPEVDSMYIRGDYGGLDWDQGHRMNYDPHGHFYSFALQRNSSSARSSFSFKVLLEDTQWQTGFNEVVNLQESEYDCFPFFGARGQHFVLENKFEYPTTGEDRAIVVYTPPSFFENPFKSDYPLLVMHDGQNLFNASTSAFGVSWQCQDTLNALIGSGSMQEIVVVGVYNGGADRTNEMTYIVDPEYGGGEGDIYLDFIDGQIIPFMQSQFRTTKSRSKTGILGSSLGGLISCYAGWTRNYGLVGCMSASFWWDSDNFLSSIEPTTQKEQPNMLYIDVGTDHDTYDSVVPVLDALQKSSYPATKLVSFIDQGAGHNEKSWGARFSHPMMAMFPPPPGPNATRNK